MISATYIVTNSSTQKQTLTTSMQSHVKHYVMNTTAIFHANNLQIYLTEEVKYIHYRKYTKELSTHTYLCPQINMYTTPNT